MGSNPRDDKNFPTEWVLRLNDRLRPEFVPPRVGRVVVLYYYHVL